MEIKRVGVVGCGIMGGGIVQVCAASGYPVVTREISQEFLDKGLAAIRSNLNRSVERGRLTAEARDETLGRIRGTLAMEDFAACDLVIEAVIEDMVEKKRVFAALDQTCPAHAIIASNTSTMTVLDMAAATKRPQQVLGLHFFNPAPVMKLLEIVRTLATSEATLATARAFGESLGKTVIIAPDTPGFIVNRLIIPFLMDAIRFLEAGCATKEDIDNGLVTGCNHPMGPLALADYVGLDTLMYSGNHMFDELRDPRFAPPVLLRRMVAAGWLGRKSGKGFYDYK
ncbi:MAG: 3-hydroxybutyryl-CoA dehydrogenase [Chloroflexi bacterium]|nr:3-hydroxybutyryl-CoA dehydrogenase [Chloroflexota bacterium]